MRGAVVIIALLLAGCDGRPPDAAAIDSGNPLDVAARDANLIVDPDTTAPMGLYEQLGAAGTDGLCVSGEGDGDLRFGVVMHFGPTLVCEGQGEVTHDGAHLSLRFDNADCAIELAYDGRSLRFPGSVPDGCKAVCGARASMAGGSMARTGWSNDDAQRLFSRRDALHQRAPRPLCM
jgi:hypothetical protein